MIVQLAGLPGTGKTTLAVALQPRLGPHTLLLDKDRVRAALYGIQHTEYSRSQDDFCVGLLHQAAARHLREQPDGHVILDGRTCSRRYQIAAVERLAHTTGHPLRIIECFCADSTAYQRLAGEMGAEPHPARNRTIGLYQRLRAAADPIDVPRLRLCTDASADECVRDTLTYLLGGLTPSIDELWTAS